jgi:hypothetical protein
MRRKEKSNMLQKINKYPALIVILLQFPIYMSKISRFPFLAYHETQIAD